MLVPERGDPTTKIGLFIVFCISVSQSVFPNRLRIQKLPPPHHGELVKVALSSPIQR
jgi:hypothetical protein